MLELAARHTHLYPGATARRLSGAWSDGPVTVEFSDGIRTTGRLDGVTLRLAPHRTAAGTEITARTWRIERRHDALRIAARIG